MHSADYAVARCLSVRLSHAGIVCKRLYIQGGPQKTGPACFIANILKTLRPNCVKVGELLQYCMLNAVITFLFKSFVALWRHLAKRSYCVMLKSICSMLINDSSISIEFTENKITDTVEISESQFMKLLI